MEYWVGWLIIMINLKMTDIHKRAQELLTKIETRQCISLVAGGELRSEPGEIDLLDKLATVFGSAGERWGWGGCCIFLQIDQMMIKKIEIEIIGSIMFIMNCLFNKTQTSDGGVSQMVIVCEKDEQDDWKGWVDKDNDGVIAEQDLDRRWSLIKTIMGKLLNKR